MSEFLKNLKSLFVEEAARETSASSSKNKDETSEKLPTDDDGQTASHIPVEQTTSAPGTTDGKISAKFTKVLLQALEKNNMGGFDYLEYKNSIKSLSKMDMDEGTRYQSAFAMAQTMGADINKLIESANHYKKVLTKEKSKFDEAARQQMEVKVNSKKAEIAAWEKEIKEKTKEIEVLKKRIDSLRKKAGVVSESLDTEARKVQGTQNDFVASYNNLVNQISADISKMTKYLK